MPGLNETPVGSRSPWRRIGLVVALVIGVVALVFFAGALIEVSGTPTALGARERALLPAIDAFSAQMAGHTPEQSRGRTSKTVFADGSYDLSFVYTDAGTPGAPYVEYRVTVEPTVFQAIATSLMLWYGTAYGLDFASTIDFEVRRRDDLFAWGDASRYGFIEGDGHAVGNLLVARRGRVVVLLLVTGLHYDDPFTFFNVVAPLLEPLEALSP